MPSFRFTGVCCCHHCDRQSSAVRLRRAAHGEPSYPKSCSHAIPEVAARDRQERIQPGCPQQNGRHERVYRELKE